MNKELLQCEEGNKLIAEFMGYVQEETIDKGWLMWKRKKDDAISFRTLTFERNWNELMPVVEKISRIEFERRFDGEKWVVWTHHPITFGMLDETGKPMVRFYCGGLHTGDTLIEAAWLAVVGFIESNNSQTQPQ